MKALSFILLVGSLLAGCNSIKNDPQIKRWAVIADKIALTCDSLHGKGVYGAIASQSSFLEDTIKSEEILEITVGMNGIEKEGFGYMINRIGDIEGYQQGDVGVVPSAFKEGYTYQVRAKRKITNYTDSSVLEGIEYQLLNQEGKEVNFSITFKR